MTQLFQKAVTTVLTLPDAQQDELARILLQFAGDEGSPYVLTHEEISDLDASSEETTHGEFATDEEVEAVWTHFRR